jgi:hypothetical protein
MTITHWVWVWVWGVGVGMGVGVGVGGSRADSHLGETNFDLKKKLKKTSKRRSLRQILCPPISSAVAHPWTSAAAPAGGEQCCSLRLACFTRLTLLGLLRLACFALLADALARAVRSRPQGEGEGGQRRSRAHPWTFVAATASAEGGAAALALLCLRRGQAADASACAARSWPRAEVREGQLARRC